VEPPSTADHCAFHYRVVKFVVHRHICSGLATAAYARDYQNKAHQIHSVAAGRMVMAGATMRQSSARRDSPWGLDQNRPPFSVSRRGGPRGPPLEARAQVLQLRSRLRLIRQTRRSGVFVHSDVADGYRRSPMCEVVNRADSRGEWFVCFALLSSSQVIAAFGPGCGEREGFRLTVCNGSITSISTHVCDKSA